MRLFMILSLVLLSSTACKKEEQAAKPSEPAKPTPTETKPAEPAKPDTAAAPAEKSAMQPVLDAYDKLHDALAADKTDADAATNVKKAAEAAKATAPEAAKAHLDGIIAAADPVAQAADVATARKAFGELSKHVVALVESDPALKASVKIYECPMVEDGFKRWAQVDSKLENPYFGSKMLTCGEEVK